MLPFPPRVFAKDYLAINPLGTIPLYIDGDARMTESSMICHWLAERHGKLQVAKDEEGHAEYLNFVSYGEATLTFPLAVHFRYTSVEPEARRVPQAAEDYKRFFLGRLKLIDPVLQDRQWLCGERFTAADISVGYALRFASTLNLQDAFQPQVKTYLERLERRDGFKKAIAKESNG
jgi:glutathione S-transferase